MKVPPTITAISWNVDGKYGDGVKERFNAVIKDIKRTKPDIIFLQEMILQTYDMLNNELGRFYYMKKSSERLNYFSITAIKLCLKVQDDNVVHFGAHLQKRDIQNMLFLQAKWNDLNIFLVNTHLKCGAEFSQDRIGQFNEAIQHVREFAREQDAFVLFGGDLNLRDHEEVDVPAEVVDCWRFAGCPIDQRFTWDTSCNSNKGVTKRARHRFDRFYFAGPYQSVDFKLLGTTPIHGSHLYPSDHFGILCRFAKPERRSRLNQYIYLFVFVLIFVPVIPVPVFLLFLLAIQWIKTKLSG